MAGCRCPCSPPSSSARIDELRDRAAAAGRTVQVTLYGGTPEALESYEKAGVDRVQFELPDHETPDQALRALDHFATFLP
ncbi:hypothetical protein [Nocardia donostiensis]|uniref:hypothetical protein n=1 Tax=Nocardia donostiensis TaxID=1538463 RepID=UPI001C377682|nr:hypothetical protein [Nocardia donostiensis]